MCYNIREMIKLDVSLANIHGIGPKFLARLKKLKIETVKDLLRHFPSRYEDFSTIYKIAELQPNQSATVQGVIQDATLKRSWRRQMAIFEAMIEDETGSVRAVWFNQPYLRNILRRGRTVNLAGKVGLSEDDIYLSNPAYELVTSKQFEAKHTASLVPIYPETKGLTSKGIRLLAKIVLKNLQSLEEFIPAEVLKESALPEINQALNQIHFPSTLEEAAEARRRFSFEELFLLQLNNLLLKSALAKEKAPSVPADLEYVKSLLASLPFELTFSQKRSLWEILRDMGKPRPMNRLLQGDVGSGKTIIAAIGALVTAQKKLQTAFMAPTEVLARQHYLTLKKFFSDQEIGIALLTSKESAAFYEPDLEIEIKKAELIRTIKNGEIKIVIGTHALIQKNVEFKDLALVVVDEQHRFGVQQRAALIGSNIPHFLSMSATPIPRTLAITIFGDLDLSTIDELPSGRKPIITKIVAPANRSRAYQFIREQIQKGRQAFVICPRIESADTQINTDVKTDKRRLLWEVRAVKEEYEKLAKKIFPDLRVAMLHGKMKSEEKKDVMRQFSDGSTDLVVSTSVVEVGVDVPNATIMMIEGADRFGLAQLYQFRGRVGRSEHQSFCFLFTDSSAKPTYQRLQALIEAKNGFELAEKDLNIRGPGQFFGESQTGMPDIAMRALQNPDLIKIARAAALKIVQADADLIKYPLLKKKLGEFKKEVHLE